LNAEAFLQLAEPDWLTWSHDNKYYILGPWIIGSTFSYNLKL